MFVDTFKYMAVIRFFKNLFTFYKEGFKNMTIGKTLWAIILIKLFIMFAILKVFFFPDMLKSYKTQNDKANHVQMELIDNESDKK